MRDFDTAHVRIGSGVDIIDLANIRLTPESGQQHTSRYAPRADDRANCSKQVI
jgi:hypothetical protein